MLFYFISQVCRMQSEHRDRVVSSDVASHTSEIIQKIAAYGRNLCNLGHVPEIARNFLSSAPKEMPAIQLQKLSVSVHLSKFVLAAFS